MTLRRPLRALVVFVVLAVLVACTASNTPDATVPTLGPPPTLAPGSTPLPTPVACADSASPAPASTAVPGDEIGGEALVPLPDFPVGDAFEVTGVTWTPNGFVAVGFGPMPGEGFFGLKQGIVWTSCDGVAWHRIADPALAYVTPDHLMALGSDVYIVGRLATCPEDVEMECEDVAEAGTVVLRSSSGGAWQRLPQAPDMKLAFLEGAVALDGRVAAFGTADDDFATATLWLSGDGRTWTSTTDLAGMDPITTMAARDGGVVAFGSEYVEELDDVQLMAATSDDGTHFTRADAPPLPGGYIEMVAPGPAGYVAVGSGFPDDAELAVKALALHSVDGRSWIEGQASDGSLDNAEMHSVHPLANGYVAAGLVIDEFDMTVTSGRLWLSPDGRTWRASGSFGTPATTTLASAMGTVGLVLITTDVEETEDDASSEIRAYFAPLTSLVP